jgi:hypothetical protein
MVAVTVAAAALLFDTPDITGAVTVEPAVSQVTCLSAPAVVPKGEEDTELQIQVVLLLLLL